MTPGSLQLCERGPLQPEWFTLAIADYVMWHGPHARLQEPALEINQSGVSYEAVPTLAETVRWLVDAELVKL